MVPYQADGAPDLGAEAAQCLDAASIAQPDAWRDGIFDAQSLETLIGIEGS